MGMEPTRSRSFTSRGLLVLLTTAALAVPVVLATPAFAVGDLQGTVTLPGGASLPAASEASIAVKACASGSVDGSSCTAIATTSVSNGGGGNPPLGAWNLSLPGATDYALWVVNLGNTKSLGGPFPVTVAEGVTTIAPPLEIDVVIVQATVTNAGAPFATGTVGIAACLDPESGPTCPSLRAQIDNDGDGAVALAVPPAGPWTVHGFHTTGGPWTLSQEQLGVSLPSGSLVDPPFVFQTFSPPPPPPPPPPPSGTVVETIGDPSGSFATGFCAVPGLPVAFSTTCSDGRPLFGLQFLAGGASVTQSLPAGSYTTAMVDTGPAHVMSPIGSIQVLAGQTINCTFTMATGPACSGQTSGTVAETIGDPSGSFATGFCAVPGLPVAFSTICSDGRPLFGLQFLAGGATAVQSLPAGSYTAAMVDTGPAHVMSPIGTVNVVAGRTSRCTFTMAAGPVCGAQPASGTVVITVAEAAGATYAPGFCADPGRGTLGSTVCSDGRPVRGLQFVNGGTSYSVSMPPGPYTAGMASLSPLALSPVLAVTVPAGQTIHCSFTMAAGPACDNAPGAVAETIGDASGAYATGFCAVPGLPVAFSTTCSDGRPLFGLQFLAGGASVTQSLPAGSYTAAMVDTGPAHVMSPIGPVNVPAGQTIHCTFTMAAGPVCDDADRDGVVDAIDSGAGAFTDVITGKPDTTGSIVSVTAGLTILIRDAVDPDGVTVIVGAGSGEAVLSVCSPAYEVHVQAGTTATITCGSVTVAVARGAATIVLSGDTTVSIPVGSSATVDQGTGAGMFVIKDVTGPGVTLTVEGTTVPLVPGAPPLGFTTWNFVGFGRPVDNLPVKNLLKAGQAVPLKWRLLTAVGTPVTTLARATVRAKGFSCTGTTADQVEEFAAGESTLQNLGDGYYQLNWKTPASYAGSCKLLELDLGEGITRNALMEFKH